MSLPWRGEDRQNSLPRALEGAVSELQSLLEPTPAQLAASYQRVRQTLAGLPPAADSPAPQNPAPGRWRRIATDCRRAAWAISGGAALALLAGFALGRLSTGTAAPDSPPSVVASANADPAPPTATPLPSPAPSGLELEQAEELSAPEAQPLVRDFAGTPSAPDSAGTSSTPSEASSPGQPTLSQAIPPRAPAPRRARHADSSAALTGGPCQRPDSVQRAECWLRREQPRKALQALCGTAPGPEREREQVAMLRLVAECKLGRDIRERAQRFFGEWPDSPLALRIRNECPGATGSLTIGTKSALAD